MSIFASIMNKIFHHPAAAATSAGPTAGPTASASPFDDAGAAPATPAAQPVVSPGAPAAAPVSGSAPAQVDVGAVLHQMASQKGGGGNYQSSIVDLLKLLDLDSSLDARRTLGQELGVHAGADGSAEQNVALHRAVMAKLAENGGVVPDSMKG